PSDAAAAPPRPVAAPTAPPPPLVPVELHMIEEMAPVEPIRQQLARVVMALDDDDARRTLYLVECLLGDDDAQRDWRLVRIVDDLRQL
ncbi:MAG: hypothetical protein KC464_35645, partial [Myxococcales bacterium]|nr:hypothetical protein [Myxococcales bacterium]